MYLYDTYGLGVHSALPLPELQALTGVKADVVIQIGKVDWSPPETICTEDYYHLTSDEAYFFWDRIGKYLVRNGNEIIVEPFPGVEERLVRLPLLGSVLAVLLHQRGFLVQHASAVAINGDAVVFLGGKGWGKSTLAATLYAQGHELIADDVVALDIDNLRCPAALPGFPQFKLWPESAASSLGEDPELLPRLAPGCEKRARSAADRFSRQPLPLRSIYVLSEGPVLEIKPLPPQEAMVELIGNTFVARLDKKSLRGASASLHLRQCTRLIGSVPVYRLKRPQSLSLLPSIGQLVEEQLQVTHRLSGCK